MFGRNKETKKQPTLESRRNFFKKSAEYSLGALGTASILNAESSSPVPIDNLEDERKKYKDYMGKIVDQLFDNDVLDEKEYMQNNYTMHGNFFYNAEEMMIRLSERLHTTKFPETTFYEERQAARRNMLMSERPFYKI